MDECQQSLSRPCDTLGNKLFFTGRLLVDWDATEKLKFELHASMSHDGSESPAAQLVRAFSRGFPNSRTAPLIAAYQASAIPARGPRQADWDANFDFRSDEHTSELQSLMRISYAVFCLKKKNKHNTR